MNILKALQSAWFAGLAQYRRVRSLQRVWARLDSSF